MRKVDAANIASAFSYLGGFIKFLHYGRTEMIRGANPGLVIDRDQYAHATLVVQKLMAIAQTLEMTAGTAAANRAHEVLLRQFRQHCTYDHQSVSTIADALSYLISAFSDELEKRLVIEVSPKYQEYFEPTAPLFGRDVARNFPKAADDIEEAGKCLALGRATATVFHLMRAMEEAIRALSEHLGIADNEREWGKLLSDIAKRIEAMPRGKQRDAWSEVHSQLFHVKQAWRNDTMHPGEHYTEGEASNIFSATCVFMQSLTALLT